MIHRQWTVWWGKLALPAAVFLTAAAITGTSLISGVAAEPQCKSVHGHEKFQVQPSGALTVRFKGGIRGQSVLTDQVVFSAGDPDVPSLQIFIEKFDLTLHDGTKLKYTNLGVFDTNTLKSSSLDTFTERDGITGFFGQLHENTVLAPTLDSAIGTYRGEICLED